MEIIVLVIDSLKIADTDKLLKIVKILDYVERL